MLFYSAAFLTLVLQKGKNLGLITFMSLCVLHMQGIMLRFSKYSTRKWKIRKNNSYLHTGVKEKSVWRKYLIM